MNWLSRYSGSTLFMLQLKWSVGVLQAPKGRNFKISLLLFSLFLTVARVEFLFLTLSKRLTSQTFSSQGWTLNSNLLIPSLRQKPCCCSLILRLNSTLPQTHLTLWPLRLWMLTIAVCWKAFWPWWSWPVATGGCRAEAFSALWSLTLVPASGRDAGWICIDQKVLLCNHNIAVHPKV